jgi:hypothetical protein
MDAEGQRLAALEDGREEVLRRIDLKEQLAGEVIDGRLGLLGAAARFRDLTPATSPARHYLRFVYEGADDDERFCRAVIAWVRRLLKERRPAEAERGVARLEAELEEHVRRDGRVTLPE